MIAKFAVLFFIIGAANAGLLRSAPLVVAPGPEIVVAPSPIVKTYAAAPIVHRFDAPILKTGIIDYHPTARFVAPGAAVVVRSSPAFVRAGYAKSW